MAPTIWLADRSRYERGTGHCARARYLNYHAGPHGYGWARKAQSVPTLTGTLIHQPIAEILAAAKAIDALPPDTVVHAAILHAEQTYLKVVESRGLTVVADPAQLQKRMDEQLALLHGLTWAWARTWLPAMLADHRVVEIEQEDVTLVGCTCGLTDTVGTIADHQSRDCRGIGWMTRGDYLTQHRLTGTYTYRDVKTTSVDSANTEAAYQYRVQLLAGILGAERRLGITVDEVCLEFLLKGRYQSAWDPEQKKAVGPKYQDSPLVYGWKRPANPPLLQEDWRTAFNYVDAEGKRRKLGPSYDRTGLWELPEERWAGCLSPWDYWTRALDSEGTLSSHVRMVGPIARTPWKLASFLTQLAAEEQRWQGVLWRLYADHREWGTDEGMTALDTLVPQNRGSACHSFYGDSCEFLQLCERHPGWEDPASLGYIPRRPHHLPELEQAIDRGLLPPDEGTVDTIEEP